jgi:hypothetical protein
MATVQKVRTFIYTVFTCYLQKKRASPKSEQISVKFEKLLGCTLTSVL